MGWDPKKCLWGTPSGFGDAQARAAVETVDFSKAVYVVVSEKDKYTKHAYAYYVFNGFRICVVGHVHKDEKGNWTKPGNCYIPGWTGDKSEGWEMKTPEGQVRVIGPLAERGTFPGEDRYPHPVKKD